MEEVDVEDTSPSQSVPEVPIPSRVFSVGNRMTKCESPTTTNSEEVKESPRVRYRPGPKRYKLERPPGQTQSPSGSPSKITSTTTECCNEACDMSSSEFLNAPSHVFFFFGISAKGRKEDHKMCTSCLDKAESYYQEAVETIKEKKPMSLIPFKPGSVKTIDLEADSDHEEVGEIVLVASDVELQIEKVFKTCELTMQAKAYKDSLTEEFREIEEIYDQIGKRFENIGKDFEIERQNYEKLVGPKFGMSFLRPLDVERDGNIETDDSTPIPLPLPLSPVKNLPKPQQPGGKVQSKSFGPRRHSMSDLCKGSTDDDIQIHSTVPGPTRKSLAPTPVIIPRVMPKIGDKVFVMRSSTLNFWVRGEILDVYSSNKLEFRVKYDLSKTGRPITVNSKDVVTEIKVMSAKHIAYNLACPFILPVATRIIALFKDEFSSESSVGGKYYAGIVAEPPKAQNNYRYLVFFDDGFAQYVGQNDVFLVCETSKDVWVDVHPDSQDFIKKYCEDYPERPMVRLQKGTVVTTEWNGKWWVARVTEVDCSLVKMHFEADNRSEWIYRGSTRLSPLYNQFERMAEAGSGTRHLSAARFGNKFTIDYGTECIPNSNNEGEQFTGTKGANGVRGNLVPPGATFPNSLLEYEGKMQDNPLLAGIEGPRPYVTHRCNMSCTRPYDDEDTEIKKLNPLAYPLYLGFSREVGETPNRDISYRAPCGRVLRNYEDLQKFLTATDYNLSVEFFCFDFAVDVVHEFVPSGVLHTVPDIANGEEIVKITCVNSIDHEPPDYLEYVQGRISSVDVKINLEEDFLSCCDCTDDCLDKSKCACWKLTLDGIKKNPARNVNLEFGYQHRRLYDAIGSAIYECNLRCKCKQTCSNRVVQNPIRWQLQVFKTSKKGWAIRSLHDIPAGAFVCVYAGQILNEQVANLDGTRFGDEYLAELDYIEVTENAKAGYEDDVIEPISSIRLNLKDSDDSNCSEELYRQKNKTWAHRRKNVSKGQSVSIGNGRKGKSKKKNKITTRDLFGPRESIYIMDAKGIGNIGRYLNHSCSPNVYVQNVFVDTHDLRFPWVAFFTSKHIRAGTELTWDYNYDIGSVPGKTLYCWCGAPDCRGRLL